VPIIAMRISMSLAQAVVAKVSDLSPQILAVPSADRAVSRRAIGETARRRWPHRLATSKRPRPMQPQPAPARRGHPQAHFGGALYRLREEARPGPAAYWRLGRGWPRRRAAFLPAVARAGGLPARAGLDAVAAGRAGLGCGSCSGGIKLDSCSAAFQ